MAGTAAQPTSQTREVAPFSFYIPITKVDKEQRLVTGIATQEILDKQGHIVDYETAKAFFADENLWPGNMREMHQPKAVGKKVSVDFDDDNKAIILTSRVSKGAPDTWEKVLDTTLSMYSIGGAGEFVNEKVGDKVVKRLFLKSLAEVSYVDNGACPTAKFEIMKSVDGKLVDAEPDEPTEPIAKAAGALDAALEAAKPKAPVAAVFEAGSIRKLMAALATDKNRVAQKVVVVTKAQELGTDAIAELAPVVKSGSPEPYDIDQALGAISALERLLATEYWDAKYSVPPGAQPDPVQLAEVAMLKQAIDLVLQFLVSEHQNQFAPAAAAPPDINVVVSDSAAAEMFVKSLDVVQKAGARHSKKDLDMIQQVHNLAESLGAQCFMEGDEDDDTADDSKDGDGKDAKDKTKGKGAKAKKVVAKVLDSATLRPVLEQTLKDGGWLAPATATLEPAPEVKKLQAELDATKTALSESQAAVTKQVETVAALTKRVESLEAQPAKGGPVRSAHAVDKSLGGPGAADANGEATPADVVKALQQAADESTSEPAKAAIAAHIIKLQQKTGYGRVDLVTR